MFPQFPVVFVLLTLAKNIFGHIQLSEEVWEIKMRGRPDGLFGVAQIMRCICEICTAKFPPLWLSILSFFLRQPQLSQGMARPIMTIFGAS